MFNVYGLIMVVASFFNALSQVLLKKSATVTKGKRLVQIIFTKKVFWAYLIFGLVTLVNLFAYRGVDFKYGGAIQSIGQVFVLLLSVLMCHEKLTKNRIIGNVFIVIGVLVYSLK